VTRQSVGMFFASKTLQMDLRCESGGACLGASKHEFCACTFSSITVVNQFHDQQGRDTGIGKVIFEYV
jgi:hypothetical protein